MNHLGFILVLFSCFFYSSGEESPGLKVHFGLNNIELPKTTEVAISLGWVQIERPADSLLPDLKLYCPSNDVAVCVLYLDVGYVAGLQVSFPVSQITDTFPADPSTQGFKKWSPLHGYYPGEEHWYSSQFYISEDTLSKTTAAQRSDMVKSGETLYDGGVWVTNRDGKTLTFFNKEGDFTNSIFKKQGCVPLMGTHYYYNMSSTTSCDGLYPWFGLVNGGQLIGTGVRLYGTRVNSDPSPYLEYPPAFAVKVSIPNGPQCVYNLAEDPGIISLHIYFIENPKSILCLGTTFVPNLFSGFFSSLFS